MGGIKSGNSYLTKRLKNANVSLKENIENANVFLHKIIPSKLLYAGTEGVSNLDREAIASVNISAALTGFMVIFFGAIFYALVPQYTYRLLLPVILEGSAFWILVLLNYKRKYRAARLGIYVVHAFSAVYFGPTLGEGLPIELVAAFLFVFLMGSSSLIYRDWGSRAFCFIATLVLYGAVQTNQFLNIIEPIHFPPIVRIVVKVGCLSGIFILMALVCFSIVNSNDKAIKEKEKAIDEKDQLLKEKDQLLKEKDELLIALDKASKSKSQSLYVTNHELRNPLNAVCGNAQLLYDKRHDLQSTDKTIEEITHLYTGSRLALNIINNVLDIAKIESGSFYDVEKTTVDLTKIIEDCISVNVITASSNGVDIYLDIENLPLIYSDEKLLHKAIGNLVSNAVKFARPKTSVDIESYIKEGKIEFRVKNAGSIPKDKADKIFLPFESERNSKFEGTGLGLPIAKLAIEEKLKGTLWLQSDDEYTVFAFSIPFEPGEGKVKAIEGKSEKFDFTGKKVIIVDDNYMNCVLAKKYVELAGAEPYFFLQAEDAITFIKEAWLRHEVVDLVIADAHMPNIDGRGLLTYLKSSEFKDIPVVIASGDNNCFEDMITEGASGCALKPIKYGDLYKILGKYIRQVKFSI